MKEKLFVSVLLQHGAAFFSFSFFCVLARSLTVAIEQQALPDMQNILRRTATGRVATDLINHLWVVLKDFSFLTRREILSGKAIISRS
jgi:hypothetical protein